MEMNHEVRQTIASLATLLQTLQTFKDITDEAFEAFNGWRSSEDIQEIFKIHWSELYYFCSKTSCEYRSRYGEIIRIQDYTELERIFYRLKECRITRETFYQELEPTRNAVEKAIQKLQDEIKAEYAKLDAFYNEFAAKTGPYQFIFENPEIKRIFFEEFLQLRS